MSFSLRMKGHNEMVLNVRNLDKATRRGVRQGFYKLGKSLKATANKNILEKPKSGRTYIIRRGPTGRRFRHIASSRGESFANVSGAARRTLGFDVRGANHLEFGFRKNSQTEYTKLLEDTNKLNRPTLKIAIKQNQRNSVKLFEREIKRAVK